MNHQAYQPSPDLTPLIKSYWTLESPQGQTPARNTIIPDGCMKLIFHYGDRYRHYPEKEDSFLLPRCFLIGQLTRPYEVEPTGNTGTFFVCFHPNGFLPFAPFPVKEMKNTAVPLTDLFGEAGLELERAILNAASTTERISITESFLISRLTDENNVDQILKSSVETILTANGQLSVDDLSSRVNTNRRQLERKFSSAIGLSPKQVSKIVRLQNALKMMLNGEVISLTDVAYENDYYDQAHFIKDFKEFTGLTPKEFYGDHLKMSLVFDQLE